MVFPISRDPPEGGTGNGPQHHSRRNGFPISRDPPEGGTRVIKDPFITVEELFPISRDPPEGGTAFVAEWWTTTPLKVSNF